MEKKSEQIFLLLIWAFAACVCMARASDDPILKVTFAEEEPGLKLFGGAKRVTKKGGTALEFTNPAQYAEMEFSRKLDGVEAVSIGGWFFPYREGEQYFVARGMPEIDELGNRLFRPNDQWVNFVLGTDQHGFFMGTINGNGNMPFPRVTVNEAQFDAWNQLVMVKTSEGAQKFYLNGTLVHTDERAQPRGDTRRGFREAANGPPIRLSMEQGGMIGEMWIYDRELAAEEVKKDFEAKRERFKPTFQGKRNFST